MEERNVKISIETARKWYNSEDDSLKGIAFHTIEQQKEFLKNNEQLVKEYLMLD